MNTNLKLNATVSNIQLPKLEEIVFQFSGVGSLVFRIIGAGNIPFELVTNTGTLSLYPSSSTSDISISGKTAYTDTITYGTTFHIAVVNGNATLRLKPNLAAGIYISYISSSAMAVSGSATFCVPDFEYMPWITGKATTFHNPTNKKQN